MTSKRTLTDQGSPAPVLESLQGHELTVIVGQKLTLQDGTDITLQSGDAIVLNG